MSGEKNKIIKKSKKNEIIKKTNQIIDHILGEAGFYPYDGRIYLGWWTKVVFSNLYTEHNI
jgi:hypothetical protein